MTVIECFARDPIENIASCLSLKPDTLVFVGELDTMQKSIERYQRFFKGKGIDVNVILRHVDSENINDAVSVLTDVVSQGDDCVFDLFGGPEIIIAAAGIVYDRFKDSHKVSMQQLDALSGSFNDADGDGQVKYGAVPKITVKELIRLYGGVVAPLKPQPKKTYTLADLEPLWNIVIKNPRLWNKKTAYLCEIESHAGVKPDSLSVKINLAELKGSVLEFEKKYKVFDEFLHELAACGVVKIHSTSFYDYRYSYENQLVCQCLNGPGNLLEYKTLFEGLSCKQNKESFFNDCLMGVSIDWDGVVHESSDPVKDTKNEIDCIFMHGLKPLFISCKNGKIGEAELYKLNTVAGRFGGSHAKKMLISTSFYTESENSRRALIQRAADMGIIFEPNAANLSQSDWHRLFEETMNK